MQQVRYLFTLTIVFLFLSFTFSLAEKNNNRNPKKNTKGKKTLFKNYPITLGKTVSSNVLGLTIEEFENPTFPPNGWRVGNPDASFTWVRTTTASSFGNGAASAFINFYNYDAIGQFDTLKTPILTNLVVGDSLKFDVAYGKYAGSADSLRVEVSTNGGITFTKVYQRGGNLLKTFTTDDEFFPTTTQWRTERVGLPAAIAGNNVVFAFIAINDYGNNLFIDKIRIGSPAQIDLAVTSVSLQPLPLVEGNPTQVIAYLRWDGTGQTPASVSLTHKVGVAPADENDGINETVFPSWAGNPLVAEVAFTVPFLPPSGNFQLYVRGFLQNDGSTSNDITYGDFFATFQVNSFPYFENFESVSDSGWSSGAISSTNEWMRATPKKTQIDRAWSGTKSWITLDSLNHSDNINIFVTSPVFDFSTLATPPVLNFYHNYLTDGGFDGGTIEYTLDGVNYTILGEFEDLNGYNWYDNDSPVGGTAAGIIDGANWSGTSEYFNVTDSGWVNSILPMIGFEGLSNVQFRMRYVADEVDVDEGWAFDDVYIYQSSSIAGFVFEDINGNGIFDEGEPPIFDAELNLTGTEERTVYTDTDGYYVFNYLQPGTYTISLYPISGTIVTLPESPFEYQVTVEASQETGNNFGVFYLGSVAGMKFNDANGNRLKEIQESGMENWTIVLEGPMNDTILTDANGNYSFSNLTPGDYQVYELQQEGFSQTFPPFPGIHTFTMTSALDLLNQNFGNGEFGMIAGKIYDDLNGNGFHDAEEYGLANWKISITGAVEDSLLSDSLGYFSFMLLPFGNYTVSAEIKSGYLSSSQSPEPFSVNVNTATVTQVVEFPRFKFGTIRGTTFLDENGNGIKDVNDIGLENWIIKLNDGSETSTDMNGNYTFTNLLAGTYTVRESLQTGWTQTLPTDPFYTIEIFSGTDTANNDFGNFKNGSISGMKFEDMNANGILDSNDVPLTNWNISFTNGEETASVQTDENGMYSFTNLGPGTYIISEETVNEYYQSFPVEDSTYIIILTSGDSVTNNDFGNYRLGSISGKKYLDENVNGILDSNEIGIENWIIKLSNGDSVVTDAQGNYMFNNLAPNTYTVSEILLGTWTQSEPESGTYSLEIISNLNVTDRNFGNFQKGSISGVVFNDKNRNAIRDANELGLENWEIQLSGTGTDTTFSDPSGNYTFLNLLPGNYLVKEVLKPKHYQTSPAETVYTLKLTSGEHELDKNFGNFEDTTKYRTFKSTPLLAAEPVKMKFKNNTLLTLQPTLATALYNVFARLGKTGSVTLGVPQTDKIRAKQYGWILFKKASDLAKFYTEEHTAQAFPIDSLRVTGKKSKKLSKAIKPVRKKYDNIAWESGVLLNLNIVASEKKVLPPYFGQLVIDTPITLIGRNMQGQTLAATGRYFDSLMTYWKEMKVDSSDDYLSIALFVDLVLKRIHNGFYDTVIASNYSIDTIGVISADTNSAGKANGYAVTLKGIKSASDVGVVKYVPQKIGETYFSSIRNLSEPEEFLMQQNYPNPFNPATTIEFYLPEDAKGTLQVFNILGQKVAEVFKNKFLEEGENNIVFDAKNIPSGVYFYRFDATGESGTYHSVKKMIVLK